MCTTESGLEGDWGIAGKPLKIRDLNCFLRNHLGLVEHGS